jgi:CDP-diacylglycerol--serine O-phosphatidyltransferase
VKKIAILPTLLTLSNAVCGFAAIAFASTTASEGDVYFTYSALLIFAAMGFDALDGYAARLSKTASDFGGQLDSLCDAISFGAAPAFLLLRLGQDWEMPVIRQALAVIAVLYMVCAVLRLARFNLENTPDPASHKRFRGLPSPAAAGCLASLALLRGGQAAHWMMIDSWLVRDCLKLWAPLGTLVVALLMVSRLSYPHLTKQLLRGRRHFSYLIRIIMAVCLLALLRELALLLVFWGYALTFPTRFALARSRRRLAQPAGLDEPLPQ